MATWQYQCVSCGSLHDSPLRPEGSVYLRCAVTHEWAWHDPSRFVTEVPLAKGFRAKAGGVTARSADRASSARARTRKPAARRAVRARHRKTASRRTARTSRGRSRRN